MHAKIEKMLNMIKAQEHYSSESFDTLKLLIKALLKNQPATHTATNTSTWIIK